jgi:glycosyltransferase involved in cell wall biosynthesis
MHEITPEFYVSKYGIKESSLLIRFLKLIEKASFKFADHVLTINDPIQKLLEDRGLSPLKATVIMNAADESLFASAFSAPAPSAAAAPQPKFIMMYHGTLTHIYGLDIAIEAFGKIHRELTGTEFWILGNGPERSALEKLAQKLGIEDKVKFIGNVLPQEIPLWLKRCDVGVLPTRRDVFLEFSFSNKLSEYIIMGKPVIASGLRTIRHYFSDAALAFFEPHDSSALAKQMVHLYKDARLRVQFAERAKAEYSPINWDVMKQRYLKLVASITGAEPGITRRFQSLPANVVTPAADVVRSRSFIPNPIHGKQG